MQIGKEYPATHSMSTAWYIVDDEGNVGIIEYDENGPVPWGVEDTSPDDLIYGHWEENYRKIIKFNLTNEQVLDLLKEPHSPLEEDQWFDCVVKIDIEKRERFLELCNNEDIETERVVCLSEDLGLYSFESFKCVRYNYPNDNQVIGSLKTMIDEHIIIEVYRVKIFDMNDEYHNGEIVFQKEFDSSPYYMFHQPYWIEFLPKKMNQPEHPVKLEQIPEQFRHRLHRIPGKFKNMDTFQIAEYYPCNAYGGTAYIVDGCSYQSFPLPNGAEVYTKVGMCHYPFFDFCSEKEKYRCEQKCSSQCCQVFDCYINDKPTVLIIFDPREQSDYQWLTETNIVIQNSFATPYISRLPYRIDGKSSPSEDDVIKCINEDFLLKVLAGSRGYLDTIINEIQPRVILVTDMAKDVVTAVYKPCDNRIKVDESEYPFYPLSELQKHSTAIEQLAKMPFRGKLHPLSISAEEMDALIKSGIAKAYSTFI